MEAQSEFVRAILKLCGVSNISEVTSDMLNGDHTRVMGRYLPFRASGLIMELAESADREGQPCVCQGGDYERSELLLLPEDDALIVCLIYQANGRVIEITPTALVVAPNNAEMERRRTAKKQLVLA